MAMTIDALLELLIARGGAEYHGEAVTQLEHALQAATLAVEDAQPATLVAAALLHDIGHLLGDGPGAPHEELGLKALQELFPAAVTDPVRLHVAAKRYLVTVEADYAASLSPASIESLRRQGGPMTPTEQAAFEAEPHFSAAVQLRRYDDAAKVVAQPTPGLTDFRPYLERSL
ncbi:MAG: HD domain-containing protein [Gemmataceae bacterium]